MCDVASAVAIGAAVVGTIVQQQGQQRQERALDSANAAAIQRQAATNRQAADLARDRENRATAAVEQAVPEVNRQASDATMEQGRQRRAQEFAAATPQQTEYLPGTGMAPQIVRDAVDQERAGVASENAARIDALARLGSWADALRGIQRTTAGAAEESAFQGLFSRRDAQNLARENGVNAGIAQANALSAQQAGAGARTAGNLLVAVGPAAATYGGSALGGLFRPAPNAPKNKPAPL